MDWLSDINVARMTLEQKGAYIDLLAYCWLHGSIPGSFDALQRMLRGITEESLKPVLECFRKKAGNSDDLVHPRLEEERRKQSKFKKKMSESGKVGNRKRWLKHLVPMDTARP